MDKGYTSFLVATLLLLTNAVGAQSTLLVPVEHSTIQAGIVAASSGDTVLVSPGTYVETIDFLGKAITVVSSAGSDVTIIDGFGGGSVVTFASGEGLSSRFEGFTVTGGSGVQLLAPGSLTNGGGIFCNESAPTIVGCRLIANTAGHGANFAAFNAPSAIALLGCTFADGIALSGGGGVYAWESDLVITGCTFENNYAAVGGGLTVNDDGPGSPIVATVEISDCRFDGNYASVGGGVYVQHANLAVSECSFVSNEGTVAGAGMVLGTGAEADVSRSVFVTNDTSGVGGGALLDGVQSASFTECLFMENNANVYGGGIHTSVNPNTIFVDHCVLWGNSSSTAGAVQLAIASTATIVNSVAWNNGPTPLDGLGLYEVSYSIVEGGFPGLSNFDTDPLFVDPSGGDFSLLPGSPGIDAGDPQSLGDADGTVTDIGMFSATYPLFIRGDVNGDNAFDISDPVATLQILFIAGSESPLCAAATDANDDGSLDVSDAVFGLAALFIPGTPPLAAPFPTCGVDSSPSTLGCDEYLCP